MQQKILNTGERKQDIQLPKLIQKMVIIMNEVPTENTEMQVEYDYATNILTTKGIQIIGMTTAPLNLEMSDVHLRVLETAPLKGNQMQVWGFYLIFVGYMCLIPLTSYAIAKADPSAYSSIYLVEKMISVSSQIKSNHRPNKLNFCLQKNIESSKNIYFYCTRLFIYLLYLFWLSQH